MTIFSAQAESTKSPKPLSRTVGIWMLVCGIVGFLIFALMPAPYVIFEPGPVFNTLGSVSVSGKTLPMIEVHDETTYEASGALDLLTVSTIGDPYEPPSWFELVQAWFDPSRTIEPMDAVYPPGESISQLNEESLIDMQNSQKTAIAAALTQLGYEVPAEVSVGSVIKGTPADGSLEAGDVIVSLDGQKIVDPDQLRQIIRSNGATSPISVAFTRNGIEHTVEVTPVMSDTTPKVLIVGFYPVVDYKFPVDIDIQLENVGGPSGGQMFALGIIDVLTPGSLNGGKAVAGTGTISADGTIGPIGGIRQKLYGALWGHAKWFLAPKSNCDEVVGHIPTGLHVVAVSTLKDSIAALEAISSGKGISKLPTCAAG